MKIFPFSARNLLFRSRNFSQISFGSQFPSKFSFSSRNIILKIPFYKQNSYHSSKFSFSSSNGYNGKVFETKRNNIRWKFIPLLGFFFIAHAASSSKEEEEEEKNVKETNISQEKKAKTIEPSTKAEFENEISTSQGTFSLIGVGVRTLTFLKFNVYAIGFYVEEVQSKRKFMKWKNKQSDNKLVTLNDALFDLIVDPSLYKVIRIIPARSISSGHLKSGFIGNLTPRLANLEASKKKEIFTKLNDVFPENTLFSKDSKLDIICKYDIVTFEFEGKILGKIESRELCQAFAEIYVGKDSKLKEVRDRIGKAFIEKILNIS